MKTARGFLLIGLAIVSWSGFLAPTVAAEGPLLSDADLFAAINLDYPGLGTVKSAVAAKNYAAARTAFVKYLRNRTGKYWYYSPPDSVPVAGTSFNRAAADKTVNGDITVCGITYHFPNSDIDWFFNATIEGDPDNKYADDPQWQSQLNRMWFWGDLGPAWKATGDNKYIDTWLKHLRSWLKQCPRPPATVSFWDLTKKGWGPLDVGLRLGYSWPGAFMHFLKSSRMTETDVINYVKSTIEQSRFNEAHHAKDGNHVQMEMNGMYATGILFPELKESEGWRRKAIDIMYAESQLQFLPDGAQYELSPMYHATARGNVARLYNLAKAVGRLSELPDGYIAVLEKAYEYEMRIMTPNRSLPNLNDGAGGNPKSSCAEAFGFFPYRKDFQWVATDGKSGTVPAGPSAFLPYAGHVAMRSGWERDANYMLFDVGPFGYFWHSHEDKLNVVVYAHGREILFDSGGGEYSNAPIRTWGMKSQSHNTVLVDGKSQRGTVKTASLTDPDIVSQKPIDARWQSTASFDFAAGLYERGYGDWSTDYNNRPAKHHRRVLFVRPDVYLVADTLIPNDDKTHSYEARWHLVPTATTLDATTKSVTTTEAGQPNLAVVPLLTKGLEVSKASGVGDPLTSDWHTLLGWYPVKWKGNYKSTTVRHLRNGTGTQRFLTLLLPLRAGMANPVKSVSATGANSVTVTLTDGRTWTITVNPDAAGGIAFVETGGAGRKVTAGGDVTPTSADVAPAAPTNLVATAISPSQINLTWTDKSGNELGFKIERKNAGGAWAQIAATGANVTSYSDKGLNSNTLYTYRVHAHNAVGNGAFSNEASATTANKPPTIQLTGPANGASFMAPAEITLTATASDPDGSILKVEFFSGATRLGEDTTSPYALSWVNVAAGSYSLVAKATDSNGATATSAVVSIAVKPPAVVGNGNGLLGEYFDDMIFAMPKLCRTDATVDFAWGTGSPASVIAADTFSVQWSGQLQAQYSETYTIFTQSDDGVRLWIDGNLLVDNWTDHSPTENSATVAMVAGQKYDVRMIYYENGGGAVARLLWSSPSTPKQVVPQSQLYSSPLRTPENPSDTVNGLDYAYYQGTWDRLPDFAALTPIKTGTVSDFNLGVRARDDSFGFRFTGFVEAPSDGSYTFHTNSDDGSRLYIGSTLVVDNDGLHTMRERSGTIGLKAGKHALTAVFFEKTGGEGLSVSWSGPGIAKQLVPVKRLFRPIPANGDGLLATYFDLADLTGKTATRIDKTIDFDWGKTAPLPGFGADTYSVRWTGYLVPPVTGSYTFTARTDDGVRLWIDGTLAIDYWKLRPVAESSGVVTLNAGQRYSIRMEYYNGPSYGVAQLYWTGPGIARQIVPQKRLYSK